MTEVPGVDGVQRIDATTVLAWSAPGRYFSCPRDSGSRGPREPSHHSQVAVVAGGHPGAASALADRIGRSRPSSTFWAPAVAQLLGLPFPPDAQARAGAEIVRFVEPVMRRSPDQRHLNQPGRRRQRGPAGPVPARPGTRVAPVGSPPCTGCHPSTRCGPGASW